MPGLEQQLTLVPCELGGSAEAALCNARALIAGVAGAAHLSDSDWASLLLAPSPHEERFSAMDVLLKDFQCQVTHTSLVCTCSEKWLHRHRAHKTSIRVAPGHHTRRHIPCGLYTSARSTREYCSQHLLRHNRSNLPRSRASIATGGQYISHDELPFRLYFTHIPTQ